jgi:hypothetical protein
MFITNNFYESLTNMTKSMYLYLIILMVSVSCTGDKKPKNLSKEFYNDKPFAQEYHEGYSIGEVNGCNDVRSITLDSSQNVWIATGSGVYVKYKDESTWQNIQDKENKGPSFSVEVDPKGSVWFSTWNGLYKFKSGEVNKIDKVIPPISEITATSEGIYAFGNYGVWFISNGKVVKEDINISKGIRDAVSDGNEGLWIASDAGLYHYKNQSVKLFQDENELISCYLMGVAYSDDRKLWVGGLGGITIRDENRKIKILTPNEGMASAEVNCVKKAPDGVMWIGTNLGIVRYLKDGSHSLRFSKRWLMDDKVREFSFDNEGNAWIATANGVSVIKSRALTLSKKADYFYAKMMKNHVRDPWIVHGIELEIAGDTSTRKHIDDDNDGEYTAIYMSMESLRYAATGDNDAKEKAKKAFYTLKYLQEVTETDGFFARTVIPADWNRMHDLNRKYTNREFADELVKNPRFKRVENRWRKSKNGKWLWKGDTSSDEMCGHFMGYYYYYEFAADEKEKEIIRGHVKKIIDYLMKHDYNFVDIDGSHTLWGVWSPDKLNRDADWGSERSLNSFELLSYLKFVYHITNEQKYQNEYLRLLYDEGYLDNISRLNNKNPAWEIYFDVPLAGYLFPILVNYEDDPSLKKVYEDLMDEWFEKQKSGNNPLNNFIYCYARDKKVEIEKSIEFLVDTPLDLIDWKIDQTKREDVHIVRKPILEETQINILVPASERATVRWDKNPWSAIQGNPHLEREPVFWLFPYWMARYLEIIKN